MNYAQIDENNICIAIAMSSDSPDVLPENLKAIPDYDMNYIGKFWNGTEFITAPDTNSYLHVSVPDNPLAINTDIAVTASVKDAAGNILPLNATYYVPVMRKSDNLQAAFLPCAFVAGQATVVFKVAQPGIYTIKMDAISPMPTALLAANVGLIVL